MKSRDKYRGCLIGGAVGDALGYPVEFLNEAEITGKYGEEGISEYELRNGVAEISDDTQMTLFTATGLLYGETRFTLRGIGASPETYVSLSYKEWYKTQTKSYPLKYREGESAFSWLVNIPELFSRRGPGNTCLTAIRAGAEGTVEEPINQSKGCGGIMRVAPVGLFYESIDYFPVKEIDDIGADVAALTHGHELGYIPAAALVHIITLLTHTNISLEDAVADMRETIQETYRNARYLKELLTLIDKAVSLSKEDISDRKAIRELGEGWVAEETLAISLYCSLKYPDNFDKAIRASVNHAGDSDSTGAVTGNIMGALLGLEKIPEKYLHNLELKDVILEIADDLYSRCPLDIFESLGTKEERVWEEKYVHCTYSPHKN